MKKNMSAFYPAVRLIRPALLITLVTSAAQLLSAWLQRSGHTLPERLLDAAFVPALGGAGFLVLTAVLCVGSAGYGSRTGYTVGRLSVSERRLNFLWALTFTAVYAVFWALQAVTAALLCRLFCADASDFTLALAWYRHPYLHNLLPGLFLWGWIRLGLLLPALGTAVSAFAAAARRGRFGLVMLPMSVGAVITFRAPLNETDASVLCLMWMALLLAALWSAYLHNAEDEKREGAEA